MNDRRKYPAERKLSSAKSVRSSAPVHSEQVAKQLRQITAKALDALKNPSAIPSNVILAALLQARSL